MLDHIVVCPHNDAISIDVMLVNCHKASRLLHMVEKFVNLSSCFFFQSQGPSPIKCRLIPPWRRWDTSTKVQAHDYGVCNYPDKCLPEADCDNTFRFRSKIFDIFLNELYTQLEVDMTTCLNVR